MGCGCGGARGSGPAGNRAMAPSGRPVVFRLRHPSGGSVDYPDEGSARAAKAALPGSDYAPVDPRTGKKINLG